MSTRNLVDPFAEALDCALAGEVFFIFTAMLASAAIVYNF